MWGFGKRIFRMTAPCLAENLPAGSPSGFSPQTLPPNHRLSHSAACANRFCRITRYQAVPVIKTSSKGSDSR